MIEKLQKYILNGEFELARQLYCDINYTILKNDIHKISYDTENVATYLFILYMIFHKNEAELHYIATSLLINQFVYLHGAYYIAYNHLLKAIQLDSNNIKYLENLLLFYHIPDKILKKEEALRIANQIIKICPNSKVANSILEEKI